MNMDKNLENLNNGLDDGFYGDIVNGKDGKGNDITNDQPGIPGERPGEEKETPKRRIFPLPDLPEKPVPNKPEKPETVPEPIIPEPKKPGYVPLENLN